MSNSDKRRLDARAVAGGALGVEYVGQIDGSNYDEHLRSPAVQAVIESAREAGRSYEGCDPTASRAGDIA